MPERTLLEILARTALLAEWWRRFGPASGSDPKLADPFLRYVLTTFTYGATSARRRPRGTSAASPRTSSARPPRRHFTTGKLNRASADVVNAYLQLDLVRPGATGRSVAADGTQIDTLIDNLLAETTSATAATAGSPTTTSPTTTSRCSPTSSPAACGRPSTSSKGCCSSSPSRAGHGPRRHAGPELPGARPGAPVRVRADAAHPQLEGPQLLPARRRRPLPAHRRACSASPAATSSTGT